MRRPLFHHHKHTGKLIHHRHTSYPVLLALMVIVGGLIFLTDRVAKADDLIVTATVPAPIPVGTPVFTAPDEGTVTDTDSVNFAGTCPIITPAVIIALHDGSTLLGSGLCQNDGTFAVTASLTSGTHTIIATVVTITGDNGESSTPLHITYTPPPVPVTPSTPSSPARPHTPANTNTPSDVSIAPLDIISEKPFIAFKSNLKAEWRGRFAGGVPPYVVTINWGDGKSDIYNVSGNDLQVFTHQYRQNRLYAFSITVQDNSGLSLKRNYVAMQSSGAPSGAYTQNNFASFVDSTYIDPYVATIGVYLCLLLTMLMMWRYEHIHYPYRVIGVPVHYPWQAKSHSKKHTKK